MKRFLTLIFSLCAAGILAADVYVSPNGSDRNPGTEKAPLQKVQTALNKAKPGDTIKLLPGVYREENLTLVRSGSANKAIRIEGLRDSNGQYLAVLEPAGKVLKNWQKAPEIPAAYGFPWAKGAPPCQQKEAPPRRGKTGPTGIYTWL